MQARALESSEEVDLVKAIMKGSVSADILPIQIAYCLYSNWHAMIKEGSRFSVSLNMRVAQTTSQPASQQYSLRLLPMCCAWLQVLHGCLASKEYLMNSILDSPVF